MATIQVVLEADLLRAADRAARREKINRSALFREALREHLERLAARDRERRDREGFVRYPDSLDEPGVWDKVADWPRPRLKRSVENEVPVRSPRPTSTPKNMPKTAPQSASHAPVQPSSTPMKLPHVTRRRPATSHCAPSS